MNGLNDRSEFLESRRLSLAESFQHQVWVQSAEPLAYSCSVYVAKKGGICRVKFILCMVVNHVVSPLNADVSDRQRKIDGIPGECDHFVQE